MKVMLLALVCSLGLPLAVLPESAWAQPCPARATVGQQVQQALTLTLPEERAKTLKNLERTCVGCRYADDSVYVKILKGMCSAYLFTGQNKDAYASIQKALTLNLTDRPSLRQSDLADLYYYVGLIEKRFKNYPAALEALEKATRIGRTYNQLQDMWPSAYRLQIEIYYAQGDYERAFDKAVQSELINRQASRPQFVAQSLGYQGLIYTEYQQFALAEKQLAAAVAMLQQIGTADPKKWPAIGYDLAIYLTWLGDAQRLTGHYQQALVSYQQAKDRITQYGDNDAIAETEADIGLVLGENLRQPKQAMSYFSQALTRTTDAYLRAHILNYCGQTYQLQGQYKLALEQYQKALSELPFGPHTHGLNTNPDPQAIRLAAKKEYVFAIIQNKANTWLDWGIQTNNRLYVQQALATYRIADQMIDFMRWEYAGQRSKLYWRQKTRPLYERAIQACYRLGDAEQAYYFFEKSRAVLLTDRLNELGASRQLSASQSARQIELQHRIKDLQDKLAQTQSASPDYAVVQNELVVQEERLDSLRKDLETSNPIYYRYKYANTVSSPATVQRWLQAQKTTLVTYFVGDSALYVLSIRPAEIVFHRQQTGTYASLASQYMDLLSNPDAMNAQFSSFLTVSNALYRQVLAPLKLPSGRVVISPDGFFIPFDALSRSATQPDYLLADYAFSYTYSAQILLKSNQANTWNGHDFLGMAPVTFNRQATLAGSDVAVKAIGQQFVSPAVLTGGAATRKAFRSIAPVAGVVQLFTHADADSTNQEPLLYFADSTLKLSDLASDRAFQTDLLVLAACKTGIGQNQKGEGVFSLARGFAALNIPSIVTTLWSIENQPTYRLTSLFYQQLLRGQPKDLALQQAKLAFYRTAPRAEQLPTHWAGLILIGQATPITTSVNWTNWAWLSGFMLLTLAVIWTMKRRGSDTVVGSPEKQRA